jgi:single-strand DNA-binding protein
MSISFNKVLLVGRLTRDPETKFAASGTQIATFSLAVDRDYPKESDATDFIRVVTFGKTAEFVGNYLLKGRLILVEGSLRINKWERDGEKKQNAEVVASNIRFLEAKAKAQGNGGSFTGDSSESEDVAFFGSDNTEDPGSDDIPF